MVRLKRRKSSNEQIEETADKPIKNKKIKLTTNNLLSSGSTLLNLACSNNPFGAFLIGRYYWLVGDSDTGKTFLSMTCFAEALLHPRFKEYELIYDNVEDGMLLDLDHLFNEKVAEKVKSPAIDKDGEPVYSESIEDFYYNVDDAVKTAKEKGKPFIYILDSMDGLTSHAADAKFEEQKEAHRKGKEVAGSYGDGKAKKNSEGLRKVIKGLRETNSILIIISQTRDNITGKGYQTKSISGGHSLKFYAAAQIWSYPNGQIKKTVKGKDRQIGIDIKIKMKKNRLTGQKHEVYTRIYPSFGIDDIGACVDYLVSEKWWSKSKQTIDASEFEIVGSRDKLIAYIEENNLHKELQKITGRCWKEIQDACCLVRHNRYSEEKS